jgi:protoporphyrinogen oxidase
MERVETLIVGAGPTGLGAAWRLQRLGVQDWLLCEAEATPGGLACSVIDEHGFTWDMGGHVQFSHYDYFDELMDELLGPEGWISHERESWIWTCGAFVPYPFQLNLHRLPADERQACLRGLISIARAPRPAPRHFAEWIDAVFGEGIAAVFLRPYNLKVWAHPLEQLDWRWTGDRVAPVDLLRLVGNLRDERDDVGWGPNQRFRFPARGGTGAIWTRLAERLIADSPGGIRLRQRLVAVDTRRHVATFDSGQVVEYQRLLSTMPVDQLIARSDLAGALEPIARRLAHSSTHVIGVALHGNPPAHLQSKCWMYFPGGEAPFYRVTVFSRYSPQNVPDATRYWSLMAEVSASVHKPVDDPIGPTIRGLERTGMIDDRSSIHHIWHRRLPYGYPVPTLDRDEALDAILPALEERGVYSRGRFGAWKYEVSNQDHSFAQGVEAVDRWLLSVPERTLFHPEIVNDPARVGRAAAIAS